MMNRPLTNLRPVQFTLFLALISIFSISHTGPETGDSRAAEWAELLKAQHAAFRQLGADSLKEAFAARFREDHPVLADWLTQDVGAGLIRYFEEADDAGLQVKMIEKVLAEVSDRSADAADFRQRLQKLHADESGATDADFPALYLEACEMRRSLRLAAFLAMRSPVIFAQHHNFKMSFIGYTEGLSDARHERFFKPGARLTQLSFDGIYSAPVTLIDDPHGLIRDVDASPDGKRLLFAWKKSDRLDDYHIYEYDLENGQVSQLTEGLGRADYEPVYLPDGDIIFTSTRPEQSVPCYWTDISNLYRMDGEGRYMRRLAIDQVHTLYPQVLEDGRVIYTRWDYSDRGQNYPHPLFNMNPDGTDQRVYYGGNSWFPTSLLHARAIPGSDKVMAVAAGHHTRQHGKVVVLDVSQGRDEGKGMSFVAPKREVPYERVDRAQQTGDQFRYPYPINETEFLVSFLPEDSSKDYPKYGDDAVYGLYWMDVDGNRELLYQDHDISVGRPVLLNRPGSPPVIPDTVDYQQQTGVYYVHDVYAGVGLKDIPRGTAKKIRVVRLNYRAAGIGASRNFGEGGGSHNGGPIAVGNGSWDIKEILGDVDIHEDGSALFEVPAMESIYLQVLDEKQRVIQTTRSWDTVRPGEKKACKGCHAKENANFHEFKPENTLAWKHGVQQLKEFYGPPRGFSFIKEIQPILDDKCVTCHDGSREDVMSLKGDLKKHDTDERRLFSESYLNLTHAKVYKERDLSYYLGDAENEMVNWISKMSEPTEMAPYSYGAATSRMMDMLEAGHHGVTLTREEYGKMAAWLDLLVPFVGEYREAQSWTAEELAYYNYYDHKRAVHTEEEIANIKAWLAAQDDVGAETGKTIGANGYRPLDATAEQRSGTEWTVAFPKEVMIDRVDLVFDQTADANGLPESVELRFPDQSTLGQDINGQEQRTIMLGSPRLVSRFRLELQSADKVYHLREIKVWGREMNELPHFESHHPYLQLTEQD